MAHACPGCRAPGVPRSLFACRGCWRRLPAPYRDAIQRGYSCGALSDTHVAAMQAAIGWYERNPVVADG